MANIIKYTALSIVGVGLITLPACSVYFSNKKEKEFRKETVDKLDAIDDKLATIEDNKALLVKNKELEGSNKLLEHQNREFVRTETEYRMEAIKLREENEALNIKLLKLETKNELQSKLSQDLLVRLIKAVTEAEGAARQRAIFNELCSVTPLTRNYDYCMYGRQQNTNLLAELKGFLTR